MTIPELHNEPCNCPPGKCAEFCEPDANGEDHCINRLSGEVRLLQCGTCTGMTWHQDGRCLRCAAGL